jgi:hypothetical protein
MPAPQGPALYAGVIARLPKEFDASHGPLKEFIQTLCKDIAMAWTMWQVGLLAGSNNVSGLGIGAWAGSGGGGKITQTTPFNVVHTWPYSDPDGYWDIFKSAVTADFKEKFARYASSFSFSSVPYVGVSGATPLNPGPFFATNIPGPIVGYKASAELPKDLAAGIRGKLPGPWSDNAEVLDKWLKALEGSILEQLSIWEASSQLIGDTVSGTAASGAGSGSGTSSGTGKVV